MGNLSQREDNNQGLTENIYYDNLYRLDHSTLGGTTNLQMGYDAMGNITSRSDIASGATWTYDTIRKHAVLTAGSSANTYTYDANGNAKTRNGYTVGWTSYNYPSSFTTATESVALSYGPDRQRWKEVYTNSSGTETTYHAGKLFEVAYYLDGGSVLAHYRHYVYAGNELVSIDDRSTATTPQYYVVSDHQGSYTSIQNGANPGSNFVSESFTAFGNRRNGETWSGAPTTGDESNINIVSRRGYTGESALGISMGLNHLNGRVEDSITGRFLSADPLGINLGNTQSFNRYSYVNNNPLTLIDPTGFDEACSGGNGGSNCTLDPITSCDTGCSRGDRGDYTGYIPGQVISNPGNGGVATIIGIGTKPPPAKPTPPTIDPPPVINPGTVPTLPPTASSAQSPSKQTQPPKPCGLDTAGLFGNATRVGGAIGAVGGLVGNAGRVLAGLGAEVEEAAAVGGFDAIVGVAGAITGVGEAALLGAAVGAIGGVAVTAVIVAAGVIAYDAYTQGQQPGCGP